MHPSHFTQRLVCPDCDAILELPALEEGEKAVCPRCAAALLSNPRNSLHLTAAFAFFILGAPAMLIGGLLYLLVPLLWARRLPGAIPICRWVLRARRWNMIEVFLLGALVSLLKLGKLASLTLGVSFWAFIALIFCLTSALAAIHPRELWARLETPNA